MEDDVDVQIQYSSSVKKHMKDWDVLRFIKRPVVEPYSPVCFLCDNVDFWSKMNAFEILYIWPQYWICFVLRIFFYSLWL